MGISGTAKLLYVLLLNQVTLSQKNEWFDEEGLAYMIYHIGEMWKSGKEKQSILWWMNYVRFHCYSYHR